MTGDPEAAGGQVTDYLSPALRTGIELAASKDLFFNQDRENRREAIWEGPTRWPLIRLGRDMIDRTVRGEEIDTSAYGSNYSRPRARARPAWTRSVTSSAGASASALST